jgi:hypothetical protein
MSQTNLDELLGRWAATQQLSPVQVEAMRTAVRGAADGNRDAPDVEWLWGLMRPVTTLLDGPHRLHDTLWQPYAQSA